MITEKLTAPTRNMATPCRVSPPFVAAKTGVKYCGTCHPAHSTPRIRVPTNGPHRSCSLGSAKPRHPGSSRSGPPVTRSTTKKTGRRSKVLSGRLTELNAPGTRAKPSRYSAGMPTKASKYQRGLTRHSTSLRRSCLTPARPATTAVITNPATTGPKSSGTSVTIVSGSGQMISNTMT